MAAAPGWVVREFAQGAFRMVITPNRDAVLPWLTQMARSDDPNQRRFAAETLRPVTALAWLQRSPDYSLQVLRILFGEAHPYRAPRWATT